MVMVDRSGWMDTPKLIMWPITSAAFSAAFAFASARLRLREQNFAAPS